LADYLIAFQCGFALRLFLAPDTSRFELSGTDEGRQAAGRLLDEHLEKSELKLPPQTVIGLRDRLFDGLMAQLRSVPVGLRLDAWVRNEYPGLRDQQEEATRLQLAENQLVLGPQVKQIAPKLIYEASAGMGAAFAAFWGRTFEDPSIVFPYRVAALLGIGENLLRLVDEIPEDAANDKRLVEAWGDLIGVRGWFQNAQVPTSAAFRDAVTDLIRSEYGKLGGRARVVIDDKAGTIQVTWSAGAGQPDPLEVAVAKLGKGEYKEAVRLLEILRFQHPKKAVVLYNLGMALSDMGRLELAIQHLRSALLLNPAHTNSLVGLGVALTRQKRWAEAIQSFSLALEQEPDNPLAHRNLGACLMQGEANPEEAERHLRRAVELLPSDQQALFGLGQALLAVGREKDADAQFIKVIELNDRSPVAERAKDARRKLAESSLRTPTGGAERFDAVMYCLGALKRFESMSHPEIQKIGFEIAILGQSGLDTNDSSQKYTLRSMPGNFSGLELVSMMYVAFKIVAPEQDVGFDLAREYQAALEMYRKANTGE